MNFQKGFNFMKKQRNTIQLELSEEQETMKQFLIGKGYNISQTFRNYLIELYDKEIKKEVA